MHAVGTLVFGTFDESRELLARLLDQRQPQELQQAVLAALEKFREPGVAPLLLEAWPTLSPRMRVAASDALFARPERLMALLDAIEKGGFQPGELESPRIQFLLSHPNSAVRERAQRLLANIKLGRRQDVVDSYRSVLSLQGEASRGKATFQKICAACHKADGVGHEIGPNLATVKNRGAEFILFNVLDPSREVNPQYVNYMAVTDDGRTLTGMIATETATSITLKRAEGATDTILRTNLEELAATGLIDHARGIGKADRQANHGRRDCLLADAEVKVAINARSMLICHAAKPIAILLMVLIACFVLGGIIVIIASDRGQEVARVQVPDGSSVVVAGDQQSTIRKLELRVAALENERIAATGDKPAAPPCPKHSITVTLAADGPASVGDRPIPLADVAAFVGKDLRERSAFQRVSTCTRFVVQALARSFVNDGHEVNGRLQRHRHTKFFIPYRHEMAALTSMAAPLNHLIEIPMLPIARRTFILSIVAFLAAAPSLEAAETWKAGVAKVEITPEKMIWMAGYGSRDKPAEGVEQPLWAKALVLEDPAGQRAVLVSLDLVGIDRDLSTRVCEQLASKYGLERSQIALNVSHTQLRSGSSAGI